MTRNTLPPLATVAQRAGDNARGWLQSLARVWARRPAGAKVAATPLVEEYEPRLLYSADLAPQGLLGSAAPAIEMRVLAASGEYAPAAEQSARPLEVVFVDSAVEDKNTVINQLDSDGARRLDVIVLDGGADGIEQISAALAGRNDIAAVHLFAHGAAGEVRLGNTVMDAAQLAARRDEIAQWGTSLGADADILLYGCDVAAGSAGEAFVQQLAQLTRADVAASSNLTGSAALGGDWKLEYAVGRIDSDVALTANGQAAWQGTLATFTVTNGSNNGNGSLRKAIDDANAASGADTIVFNIGGGGVQTITVLSALTITDRVTIDGSQNNGATANGGLPAMILDGGGLTGNGLTLADGADGSTISGLVIRDFKGNGIEIQAGSDSNTISNNFIGDLGEDGARSGGGNVITGAGIHVNSLFNTIGGSTAAARNVIGGNDGPGILVENPAGSSVLIGNNTIQGNIIGTELNGTTALANSVGIELKNDAQWDRILGNRISRNTGSGIVIGDTTSAAVHDFLIGGSTSDANTITLNGGDGVTVVSGIHNSILTNSIAGNAGLGIDLRNNAAAVGVTANDGADADSGGNELQNFPVLTSALVESPTQIRIIGKLSSAPNVQHQIEFFSNTTADPSGNGEGQTYLGSVTLTTDGAGDASINSLLTASVPAGSFISATATNFYKILGFQVRGSTSEFSANLVAAANVAPVNTVPGARTVNEDTPLAIAGISVNDTNSNLASTQLTVNNGTLNVTLGGGAAISAGSNGSASLTLTGTQAAINAALATVTYQGALNFNGADTLRVVSVDTASVPLSDSDTVAITVVPVNDAPTATGGAVAGSEDTPYVFAWANFNVSDVDTAIAGGTGVRLDVLPASGTLEYFNGSVWTPVALGQVVTKATIDAGSLRFVPLPDESGYDGYATAGVGNLRQDYARFSFTPVQTSAITIVNPDGAANVLAEGAFVNPANGWTSSGADAGVQNPTLVDFPLDHDNSLYVNDGATLTQTLTATFTAARNYSLAFEFGWRSGAAYPTEPGFRVELRAGTTLLGSMDQTSVAGVQGAFVSGVLAVDGSLSGAVEGSALQIRLVGTDLQANFDNLTLTSYARIGDIGTLAAMAVDIVPVNDAPTATNLSTAETYTEDTTLNLANIVVSDIDSTNVTATLTLSNVAAGSLSTGTAGAVTSTYVAGTGVWSASGALADVNTLLAGVTFSPAANFNSSFTIATSVSDGTAAPITGVKTMTGIPTRDLPIAVDDSASTTAATPVTVNVLANDSTPDGGVLSVIDATRPAHGTVTINAGNTVTYTPIAGYSGTDTFDYIARDSGDGLVHYWRLDGNAVDIVGGAAGTGTLQGAPVTIAGARGDALQFNGVNDYVNVPDISYSNEFTLAFWFKIADNTGTGFRYLYSHGAAGTQNSVNVFFIENATVTGTGINNVLRTRLLDSNDVDDVSGLDIAAATLADNQWHLYTLTTTTGLGAAVYIDGVARASDANGGNAINPAGNVHFGVNDTVSAARFHTGGLDGVALYNRPLAPGELAGLQTAGTALATVNLSVNNTAPTATNLDAAEVYIEDTPRNLTDIVIADIDSANVTATLTLSSVAAGSLNTGTSGAVTSTYNAGTGVWTASGAIANVNTLLAALTFTPTANFNGNFTIATSVTDGVAAPLTGSKAITGTAVNDAPGATNLNAAETYTEDTALNLTDIVIADVDSANVTATLTLSSAAAGSLNVGTSGAVTSTYNAGTGVWTASGAIANVNALLAGLTYTPAANFNSIFSIATSVSDGVAAAVTGSKALTGVAVNDAPALDLNGAGAGTGATLAYTENGAAAAIAPAATVSDIDSANFSGGSLTVAFTANGAAEDQLTIQNQGVAAGQIGVSGANVTFGGVVIGTFAGGTNGSSLVINFTTTTATPTAVQALINRIQYSNSSDNPSTAARTLAYTLDDGDGGTATATAAATINVTAVNDTPVADLNGAAAGTSATLAYTENAAAAVIAPAATVTDVDSLDFNGGSLTVAFTAGGTTADQLTIRNQGIGAGQIGVSGASVSFGGATIGTFSGGTNGTSLVITFNTAAATPAAAQALLRNIQYSNSSDNPAVAARTLTYTLNDGDGGAATATATATINVTAVNDAPVLDLNGAGAGTGATLAYTENGAAAAIAPAATVSDIDSANFSGGSLTVAFTANGAAEDQLTIQNQGVGAGQIGVSGANVTFGGVVIGTFAGGTNGSNLVINFTTTTATPTAVQALINRIQYANTSDNPSTAARSVTYTVDDGDGGTSTATAAATINVTAVNDAPVADLNGAAAGTSATLAYTENAAAAVIASAATVTDVDSLDFNGGSLTVAFTAGGTTADQLTIRNQGIGAGQIGVSGASVTFGGATIGTFSGGSNGTSLVITFNTATATPAAAQALIRNIQYSDTSDNPAVAARTVTYTLNDGDGGAATSATTATINVTAVNDPPTATNLSTAETYAQNSTLNLIDIQVTDPDGPAITATLTLSDVAAGSLNTATSGAVTSTFAAGVWTASGALADVNTLLAGLTFTPAFNYASNFTIATSISDGVAAAVTGVKAMTGVSSNVAPTATHLNTGETYTEDTPLNLADIVISDTDSPNVTATLSLSNPAAGALTTGTANSVTSTYDAATGIWTATGAIADVNALLASLTFDPALDFNGAFNVVVSVSDGVAAPLGGSKAMTGLAVNDAPATTPVTLASIDEDSGARLITQAELLANASDVDGPALIASGLSLSSGGGTLVDNGNGTWRFTPLTDDDSAVTFSYVVSDGSLSAAGNATLDINPVNDAPVTAPVTLAAIDEDSSARLITQAELLASASDVDGPPLRAANLTISSGAGVLVDNGDGTWSYTVAADDDSAVSFAYVVSDGSINVAASATLDLIPVNDAPTAAPVTLAAINEDSGGRLITQAELVANAADVDGPTLSATGLAISSGAGSLVDNGNGTWTYTPVLNDDTGVSFTYTISDGTLTTPGSASLDLIPVNDAPVTALVTLASMDEDSGARLITQAQLLANATDADGPALTATGLTIASGNGTLVNNGDGTWRYTPAPDDDGAVTFSYAVTDGSLATAGSAVLDLNPVNDAPVATPVTLAAVSEDSGARLITQAELLRNATDIDGPALVALNLALSSGAGTLVDNGNGTWRYTPAPDDDTAVTFGYNISDGSLSAAGSASLDIIPVNDAPVTTPVVLAPIAEDSGARLITQAELLANARDVDGPALSAANLAISSGAGTLIDNANGTWRYIPAPNDDTAVAFRYTVSDGSLVAAGTANLDITGANDAPTTSPVTLVPLAEDGAARLITQADLLANASDADGDALTASALAISVGGGSLVDNGNGTWRYTPAANDDSAVRFSYTVSDGVVAAAGTADLDLTPVNDAPTTSALTLTAMAEDSGPRLITQAELLANAVDVDGPALTASGLVISSGAGSLVDNGNGTWLYTPATNDDSAVAFSYTIDDGSLATAGTATLDLTAVNDAPVSTPVTLAAIAEDSGARLITQAELLANATDVDGPALTATGLAISGGAGTLVDNGNGTWTYTPAAGDSSAASFAYTVSDGTLAAAGSATLDITPVNHAPVNTVPGPQSLREDTVLAFTGPGAIRVADADGNLAAVRLAVGKGTVSVDLGGGATISAGANHSSALTLAGTPAQIDAALATLTYQGLADFNGADTLTVTSLDDAAVPLTDIDTIALAITAVNDAPLASNQAVTAVSGVFVLAVSDFGYTDVDGDALATVRITALPAAGTLVLGSAPVTVNQEIPAAAVAAGQLRFVPNDSATATVATAFAFQVSDGTAYSAANYTVSLTVTPGVLRNENAVAPPQGAVVLPAQAPATPAVVTSAATATPTAAPAASVNAGNTETPPPPAPVLVTAPVNLFANAGFLQTAQRQDGFAEVPRARIAGSSQAPQLASLSFALGLGVAQTRADVLRPLETSSGERADAALSSTAFVGELDRLRDNARADEVLERNIIVSSVATGAGMSVGYVLWLLRGGLLLSSLLSSLPAWRFVDPLPVLGRLRDDEDDEQDDDSVESMVRAGDASGPASDGKNGNA